MVLLIDIDDSADVKRSRAVENPMDRVERLARLIPHRDQVGDIVSNGAGDLLLSSGQRLDTGVVSAEVLPGGLRLTIGIGSNSRGLDCYPVPELTCSCRGLEYWH